MKISSKNAAKLLGTLLIILSQFVFAEWQIETRVDSMSDLTTQYATTENEEGYILSIYRAPNNSIYMHFVIPDGNLEVFSSRLPMYRIDKLPPIDLEEKRGVAEIINRVGGFEGLLVFDRQPKWLHFVPMVFGDEELHLKIINGNRIIFRYWIMGGGNRETGFSLEGSRDAIMTALELENDHEANTSEEEHQ